MAESSSTPTPPAIAPLPCGEADEFWQALNDGVLRLPRCPDTGRFIFPPTPTSPWGAHRRPEWVEVAGRGTIWSFIVAHPPLVGQFAAVAPYVTAVVELDDAPGVRLAGPVVVSPGAPVGSIASSEVAIGAAVEIDLTGGDVGVQVIPRWVLVP